MRTSQDSPASDGKGKPLQRVEIYGEPVYCIVEKCPRLAAVVLRSHTRVERGWERHELSLCAQHHRVYRAQMRRREPLAYGGAPGQPPG